MKVLIIDDEPNVREGLKVIIPWEAHGFNICGEGIDGIDGLQKIMLLNPELVLIDIKMPGMMGIKVIEEAKQKGFQGKFIITTGYSDFQYAKKAISLGVCSYVLKPIDEDELLEEIDRLAKEISHEEGIKNKLDVGERYLHTKLLTRLLSGYPRALEDLKTEYALLKTQYENYRIAILELEVKGGELEEARELVKTYLKSCSELEVIGINNHFVLLIKDYVKEREIALFNTVQEKLLGRHGIKSVVALSKNIKSIEDLAMGYRCTRKVLEKKFIFPERMLLEDQSDEEDEVKEQVEEWYVDTTTFSKELYTLLQVGDKNKLTAEINHFKKQLQLTNTLAEKVISLCISILIKTVQLVTDKYGDCKIRVPKGEMIIETICHGKDISEVTHYMKEELIKLCDQIGKRAPENTMDKIIYYIRNNYNSDLKLESLAELFNYNSAYLGKSFKNYTGKSFNVYIDHLRINRAKELLLNKDMKVYEICREVGYKHIDYFHSKFKKYVGISPLEFKKGEEGGRDD